MRGRVTARAVATTRAGFTNFAARAVRGDVPRNFMCRQITTRGRVPRPYILPSPIFATPTGLFVCRYDHDIRVRLREPSTSARRKCCIPSARSSSNLSHNSCHHLVARPRTNDTSTGPK